MRTTIPVTDIWTVSHYCGGLITSVSESHLFVSSIAIIRYEIPRILCVTQILEQFINVE